MSQTEQAHQGQRKLQCEALEVKKAHRTLTVFRIILILINIYS